MGELTTMNQKNNRENRRRLRKRSILIRKITFYSLLILFAGVVYIFLISYAIPKAQIADERITRTYNELIRILDEEPEYEIGKKYESNIPKQIKKDIETIMNSDQKMQAIYFTDPQKSTYMILYEYPENKLTVSGNVISFSTEISDNISFYKNDKDIVFYQTTPNTRIIDRLQIDHSTGLRTYVKNWEENQDNIDLYGIDTEFDDVREFGSNLTLTRKGREFKFYRLGEQIGETVTFPADIAYFGYDYILDTDNNLYYMYYSENLSNPWIQFIKVDKIDEVNEDNENEGVILRDKIKLPVYLKNDEKYVAFTNLHLEETYGNNYNNSENAYPNEMLDFTIHKVKLVPENVKNITFFTEDNGIASLEFDWYMKINYEVNGETIYEEKRINGLDSYLSKQIPKGLYQKFLEMEVSVYEVDEVIEELKQIYSDYE